MSLSDSMFLFEIVVEEIKSFIQCQEFNITSQFADLFTLNLKDPSDLEVAIPKHTRKKTKRKSKVRDSKAKIVKAAEPPVESKIKIGQSILIANNVESLKENMMKYPMQLTLWHKVDHQRVMGSTNIPWSTAYIEYLNDLIRQREVPPVTVDGTYNVFDELYSRRMATLRMSIKFSCFKDKVTTQFRALSEDDPDTFMYTGFNSKPTTILSTVKEKKVSKHNVAVDASNPGTIKTIYSGGKKKFKRSNKDKNSKATTKQIHSGMMQPKKTKANLNRFTETAEQQSACPVEPEQAIEKENLNENVVDLVKSDTDLEVNKQVAIIKSKSYSSLEYGSNLNTLNYVFGDRKGPFGNQVYCVGYFTVLNENENPPSKSPSKTSAKQSQNVSLSSVEKYRFNPCQHHCPGRKHSHISLDLPKDASHLISVTKCNHVECDAKEHKEPPTPPDDRILIDLSSIKRECCHKVEQVVGGMTAKMKVGQEHDPCYCTCECTFGFTKKTTYCNICGGYEISGDELSRRPASDMPFPCPIFHKLGDKRGKSISASGSDSKRNVKASKKSIVDKSAESEKDSKKGKKKKKDDRFKFNYGYQGIRTYFNTFFLSQFKVLLRLMCVIKLHSFSAPQIGHSHCAMPCTGTLGNVPKHMGWLWTAEDIPGMKVIYINL